MAVLSGLIPAIKWIDIKYHIKILGQYIELFCELFWFADSLPHVPDDFILDISWAQLLCRVMG